MEPERVSEEIATLLHSSINFWKVMTKVNDHGKRQQRYIVLSNTSVHNVKKGFLGGYSQRREIPFDDILGLILNRRENQLVLKVKPSIRNDYRFQDDGIDQLTQHLLRLNPHLPVWTLQTNAFEYFRTKYPEKNEGMKDIFSMMKDKAPQASSARVEGIQLDELGSSPS